MADAHISSADALVRKVLTDEHADLVREAVAFLCHQIMEAEVTAQIGAGLGERAPAERATQRCSYVKVDSEESGTRRETPTSGERRRRNTRFARWRLRQRSASRRLFPSASLRARYAWAGG